ncbi:MAG: methylmalonyl Co-A mutase-associated GTPase MeaB [Acidobacteria bacterium]|nr:methylmalonyl Co-A mutase-associated GTPase MeaB [Acidobacteriota bacterium]
MDLAERVLAGDFRAIARAISVVEREDAGSAALVGRLFGRTGRALAVGLTGAPGVGKSTLVDRLTAALRRESLRVGILAVDPTSPFSGGAILGDRIRMQGHAGDGGVFVRSMATRGQLGGLARATDDARIVLDAAGIDVVLIETVGVGQGEIDVSRIADVSVVVLAPGSGDDVQAIKAGIMEIADVFVVNKADRDGADRAVAEIEGMLSLREPGTNRWRPPVVKTCAATGEGVDDAIAAVRRFADRGLAAADRARRRARARLEAILVGRIVARIREGQDLDDAIAAIAARESDPYAAAGDLVRRFVQEGPDS